MQYFCCSDERRTAVLQHPFLNGIDFLEVVDQSGQAGNGDQTVLLVHFLKDLQPGLLEKKNVLIAGGERIRQIVVTELSMGLAGSLLSPPTSPISSPPETDDKVLVITVNQAGDFSKYTLKLVKDEGHLDPPDGFDPILSTIDFSFKVSCPSDFDCAPSCNCKDDLLKSPGINYLVKDYNGFRQLMLDRMSLVYPRWRESNAADPGIMLVELLAYVSDYLSYRQDAIATEAYLETARKRVSVRRHARLVDYYMHDGCNSRTWAHIEVAPGIQPLVLQKEVNGFITKLLTRSVKLPNVVRAGSKEFAGVVQDGSVEVFELMDNVVLDPSLNEMYFYTWARKNCCLPEGATTATLDTHLLALTPEQVLIFQEVRGPRTGKTGDADPRRRHAVKLKEVVYSYDPLGFLNEVPPRFEKRPVTEISWSDADALPFPICITSSDDKGIDIIVSVVRGNNVLVDYGRTITSETLPSLPAPPINEPEMTFVETPCDPCKKTTQTTVPFRYYPSLKYYPLTQAAIYDATHGTDSANAAMHWDLKDVLPSVKLKEQGLSAHWLPLRDLISSNSNDKNFVAEVETNGVVYLRFGNDIQGKKPSTDILLNAVYRVGNGLTGNVGADVLKHLVTNDGSVSNASIISITNPLPATGGKEPETMELVRKKAPVAYRTQKRAVTLKDYEDVSRTCMPDIQRSAATLRWTGSWRTVFLTVDRLGGGNVENSLEEELRNCIEKYRMAGQDLEVENPVFVSLEINLVVCVLPNYFRSQVESALMKVLSNKKLIDGKLGVFHPDNFSFGQPVYLSPIYTAVQLVPGVASVNVTKFQRQGKDRDEALITGFLPMGRTEIARLDNDPNFPEHGVFKLDMEGGK